MRSPEAFEKQFANLQNVARPKGHNHVSGSCHLGELFAHLFEGRAKMEFMVPVGCDFLCEPEARYARYWLFARRIDFGYQQNVAVIKASGKLVEQGFGAAVAVRLEGYYAAPIRITACKGFEDRPDFSRVMAVVVEDQYAPGFSLYLEPALDARHIAQARLDRWPGNLEFMGHRHGRKRIEHIVAARNLNFHLAQFLRFMKNPERAAKAAVLDLPGLEIGLG